MIKNIKGCIPCATTIITVIFTLAPESLFEKFYDWNWLIAKCTALETYSSELSVIINRVLICVASFIIVVILRSIILRFRCWTTIKGTNYTIRVEYGDLLKKKNCNKVIAFDECYTTKIGTRPEEIKAGSICGQYLKANEDIDIQHLISEANIEPEHERSAFENKTRYKSGTLVPNGEDWLLAFVPLNANGNGEFQSYKEYLDSLLYLWEQIDKYYNQKDVCIPILGSSGLTRLPDVTFDQQKLLDIMIESYKLTPHKIDTKLRIVCRRKDGFSLNRIGESL